MRGYPLVTELGGLFSRGSWNSGATAGQETSKVQVTKSRYGKIMSTILCLSLDVTAAAIAH